MGVTTKIKIVLAGLLVLVLVIAWVHIKSVEADNARLTSAAELSSAEAARSQAENATLRQALDDSQAALAAREEQKAALAAHTEELRRELEDLYNNDTPCKTWADSPVPDPVYRRLRK